MRAWTLVVLIGMTPGMAWADHPVEPDLVYSDEVFYASSARQGDGEQETVSALPKPDKPDIRPKPIRRRSVALFIPSAGPVPSVDCLPPGPKVALTFDDGPLPGTRVVLDILHERGVRATFFLVGRQIPKQRLMVQEMVDAGHEIGVHTYSHADLGAVNSKTVDAEIEKGFDKVSEISPTQIWRAPYGNVPRNMEKAIQLGLTHVYWSADSKDWQRPSPEVWWNNIIQQLKPDQPNVVLMHDHSAVTRAMLPELIDYLRREQYEMVTVSELTAPVCEALELDQQDPEPETLQDPTPHQTGGGM